MTIRWFTLALLRRLERRRSSESSAGLSSFPAVDAVAVLSFELLIIVRIPNSTAKLFSRSIRSFLIKDNKLYSRVSTVAVLSEFGPYVWDLTHLICEVSSKLCIEKIIFNPSFVKKFSFYLTITLKMKL